MHRYGLALVMLLFVGVAGILLSMPAETGGEAQRPVIASDEAASAARTTPPAQKAAYTLRLPKATPSPAMQHDALAPECGTSSAGSPATASAPPPGQGEPSCDAVTPTPQAPFDSAPTPLSPQAESSALPEPSLVGCAPSFAFRADPELTALIERTLGPASEHYGVVVHDLTSGRSATLHPDKVFYAASLYKLAVLYEVYRQVDDGRLRLEQPVVITEDAAAWDLGPLASLGWSAGTVITLQQALEAMITVSDNATAVLLADLVGWHQIDASLRELGLTTMRVNDPTLPVTAADLARLLARIACGQAVSAEASEAMVALLSRQRVRDRLPAQLPPDVVVAHKTGNWTTATHDAGIVFGTRSTYVIVVLSDLPWQSEPIATLSRIVYDYLDPLPASG